ncbi:hypothetical protein [Coralloluteibacterium thermophilus]|uniref:Energy transducer TonB n=1 Tax=Coralloluteibacterium thermophilum TaxID=2707049 RepID=A0ABV9NR46_9GAMM
MHDRGEHDPRGRAGGIDAEGVARAAALAICIALHAAVLVLLDAPGEPAPRVDPRPIAATFVEVAPAPPPSPPPPAPASPAPPPAARAPASAAAPALPASASAPDPDSDPAPGPATPTAEPGGWRDSTLDRGVRIGSDRPQAARGLPGQPPPHALPFRMRSPPSPRDVVEGIGALFGGGPVDPCPQLRSRQAGTDPADIAEAAAAAARWNCPP